MPKPFLLEKNSGNLFLNSSLDYERRKFYKFDLTVTDGKFQDSQSIVLRVKNENDHQPIISIKPNVEISEAVEPGKLVSFFRVTDRDSNDSEFSVHLSNTEHFQLQKFDKTNDEDDSKFVIRLKSKLDYEKNSKIKLDITACNKDASIIDPESNDCSLKSLTINVIDVNDNPMKCPSTQQIIKVSEDALPNTLIGSVNFIDLDSDRFKHDFSAENLDAFRIVNGEIYLSNFLDYENRKQYDLQVKISDRVEKHLPIICSIKIKVIDVNDNRPLFAKNSGLLIIPKSSASNCDSVSFKAVDIDSNESGRVTHEISENLDNNLKIDPESGFLSLRNDYSWNYDELPAEIRVLARDHGEIELSSEISLKMVLGGERSCMVFQEIEAEAVALGKLEVLSIVFGIILVMFLLCVFVVCIICGRRKRQRNKRSDFQNYWTSFKNLF